MATTPNYGWVTPNDTDLISVSAGTLRTAFNNVDTTVFGISATANGTLSLPVPRVNDYFGNANAVDGLTTAATTIDGTGQRIYYAPFYVPISMTVDRISVRVTGAVAGTQSRLGIYNHATAGSFQPGTRLLDAGTIDTGTAGIKSITISQALTPGIYWVALLNRQASTGYLCTRSSNYTTATYYFNNSQADYLNTAERHSYFYTQSTITSFPGTATSLTWNGLMTIPENAMPIIALRRSI